MLVAVLRVYTRWNSDYPEIQYGPSVNTIIIGSYTFVFYKKTFLLFPETGFVFYFNTIDSEEVQR